MGAPHFVFEVDDLCDIKVPVIRARHRHSCRFWSLHLEEEEAFLVSSEPAFFRIVSFPDDAALTVCCSIERLIFALRSCKYKKKRKPSVQKQSRQSIFAPQGGWEGKRGGSRPYLFQGSDFYHLGLFRRDVPFALLRGRRRRS